jgi:hypothetical protein
MMQIDTPLHADHLDQLAAQFEHWRQSRLHPHARIPEPLWEQAVALTSTLSPSRVAKHLRLRGNNLKRQITKRQGKAAAPRPAPSGFVEVPKPSVQPQVLGGIEVELHLERLLRYTARGAVALERLTVHADGDLLSTFTHPWSDGTIGIRLSPLELLEKLAVLVPLPRQHQVRYGGCLAPHSHLRAAIIPTARQQGLEASDDQSPSPHWSWARLLKRVFAIDMERCPVCQQGRLRIIAAITEGHVIQKILRHLKLAVDPPPIAPAQQAAFAWDVSSP